MKPPVRKPSGAVDKALNTKADAVVARLSKPIPVR